MQKELKVSKKQRKAPVKNHPRSKVGVKGKQRGLKAEVTKSVNRKIEKLMTARAVKGDESLTLNFGQERLK